MEFILMLIALVPAVGEFFMGLLTAVLGTFGGGTA